jgi:hypothetical protein
VDTFIGVGFGGGTAAGATVFDTRELKRSAPAYSAGFGEAELGFRRDDGLGIAVTGQSLALRGLRRHGEDPHEWDGGTGGITASYRIWRLTAALGAVGGSVHDEVESRVVYGGKAGLAFSLYHGDMVDWQLTGTVEPLVGDGMENRLYLQQAGISLTFTPNFRAHDPGSFVGVGRFDCVQCGKALLDAGSLLGRLAADGIFRALAR